MGKMKEMVYEQQKIKVGYAYRAFQIIGITGNLAFDAQGAFESGIDHVHRGCISSVELDGLLASDAK